MDKNKKEVRQTITFKERLYEIANFKANLIGLGFTDYLRYLVIKDNEDILNASFRANIHKLDLSNPEKTFLRDKL